MNLIDPTGGRTEENDVSGRRVVITTDRRAGHVQKRHNPRPGGASNIDYFRRTQSKSDIKTLAGRVVSAAINNGAIVSEGDQIIYEAEIGNIITNFFAPLGSEGQTFARVVAQPLPSLKDPNVSKEVAAELAQLAPEIAANIANDNQGDEPVEVLFVFTVYPIQESERKTTDYE